MDELEAALERLVRELEPRPWRKDEPTANDDWETVKRQARLGAAVETDDWYRCDACDKAAPNPPALSREAKSVNIEFREVTVYVETFCAECVPSGTATAMMPDKEELMENAKCVMCSYLGNEVYKPCPPHALIVELEAEIKRLRKIIDAAIAHDCDCLLNAGDGKPCKHNLNWWRPREQYQKENW